MEVMLSGYAVAGGSGLKICDSTAGNARDGKGVPVVEEQWRGTLYPARLPSFHRLAPPAALADRIRWFWIPEWDLAPGKVSRQEVLPFPALNLVVQPGGVTLSGPATRRSFRDLSGRGWAVGMLLRPAAVPVFTDAPESLRDCEIPLVLTAPPVARLHRSVTAAMQARHRPADPGAEPTDDDGTHRRAQAAMAAAAWLETNLPAPTPEAALANRMEERISTDPPAGVEEVAAELGISVRTLQRLARRHVGLPPLAMIRRYRLQEAAERLRGNTRMSIADVAADLGYADHAHLAADFRDVLGFSPSGYRREAGG